MNRLKCIFTAAIVAVVFASCANMFQKKVKMPENNSSSSLYDLLVKEEVEKTLATPDQIFVSLYDYSDRVNISWTPVKNAAYYRLERAVVSKEKLTDDLKLKEDDFDIIEHTAYIYDTNYTDTLIEASSLDYTNEKYGYVFFYRVRAENPRSGLKESKYKVSTKAVLLAPPTNVKATLGESDQYIEVTWQSVAGATRYEVRRSTSADGANAVKVGTVASSQTKITFRDNSAALYPGKDLYYSILSIATNGEKSVASSLGYGYTLMPGAPPEVKNVKVGSATVTGRGDVAAADGIPISWTAVTGYDSVKYTVYRSSSADATLVKLSDITTDGTITYNDAASLKPNVYYYYYVQAYVLDDEGNPLKGPMSKSGEESASPAEGFVISPPTKLSVVRTDDSSICKIRFAVPIGAQGYAEPPKAADSKNNYTYIVYGSSNGVSFDQVGDGFTVSNAVGGYAEKGVMARNFYKMKVVFNTANGAKESAESEVVEIAPLKAENVMVTRAAAIPGYTDVAFTNLNSNGWLQQNSEPKANSNGVYPVKITWQAPEGGAYGGYHIYRCDKYSNDEDDYSRITTAPITATEYIDEYSAAKAGTILYYKVLSLNSLGQGAEYSDVDSPTLIDIVNTKGENVNAKWPNPNKPEYAGKAKIIDVKKGRGFGWGALTVYQYMQEQRKTVVTSQAKLVLMHKPKDTDKVGKEYAYGDICGQLYYDSTFTIIPPKGIVKMPYTDYADLFIQDDPNLGVYFFFDNGNTNTDADTSANGIMNGYITHFGMYPGWVRYDNVEIKGGAAAGGTYGVIRKGIEADSGDDKSKLVEVVWQAGN